jgi:peptide deformylase
MILPVRLYGDPVLRKPASPISRFDENLKKLAEDMIETMYHANGVGLAAPQIGLAKRLFTALKTQKDDKPTPEDAPPPQTIEEKRERWGVVGEFVMINPKILHKEGEAFDLEGCLSIPGLYIEEVPRNYKLKLRYQDLTGQSHELEAEGHFARVIQHELDHLNGVLFLDRLPEAQKQSFMDEHRKELAEMQRDAKALLKELKSQPQNFQVS